ncbi:hypothetical protein E1B28_003850 [Marasmius oreades]|uniref:Uncharacterized protein n=1 Tax=Marasmius oreades TaxID=181124 RepID=A0A9P7UXC9_9AGAR|nr:uncharacterized protein E1B28_003850 [Marasmius oreades]KAG7096409.1 hypothetical protein E1B28_003850 [Marasmius oreades]
MIPSAPSREVSVSVANVITKQPSNPGHIEAVHSATILIVVYQNNNNCNLEPSNVGPKLREWTTEAGDPNLPSLEQRFRRSHSVIVSCRWFRNTARILAAERKDWIN